MIGADDSDCSQYFVIYNQQISRQILVKLLAVKRALKVAEVKFGASSPQILSSKVMTYKEAMRLGPEPQLVPNQDPWANMLVRIVEMKGAFKVRSVPARVKAPPTFTKALVFLRASDGQEFEFALSLE